MRVEQSLAVGEDMHTWGDRVEGGRVTVRGAPAESCRPEAARGNSAYRGSPGGPRPTAAG